MKDYFKNNTLTILVFILSIVSIVIIVGIDFFGVSILLGYLILLQKILSFFGIIYFVISTIMLRKIIVQIRTNN